MTTIQKGIRITTPQGSARFASLDKPDTKFSEEGVYTIQLRLTKEDGQELRDKLFQLQQDKLKEEQADGKNPNLMAMPIKDVIDDDGVECYDFRFKMKPSYTSRKTKEKVKQSPKVFDASLQPMSGAMIGNGSKVKVNFIADKYACPMGVGVAMRLNAVQVIDLVSVGSGDGDSPEGLGFAAEEGFVSDGVPQQASEEEPATATTGTEASEEGAASGSDF